MFNMFSSAYKFMSLMDDAAGGMQTCLKSPPLSNDTSPAEVSSSLEHMHNMSRPPPLAHSGGHMFSHMISAGRPSLDTFSALQPPPHMNSVLPPPLPQTPPDMQAHLGGSPLVVPQPMKPNRSIKSHHCRMCDQVFESKSELLVHSQQVHKQDPKPYKCMTCTKCFANSSYLSQHARIHAGVKPYKCQICERRFTQLCHLQQHIRTHTGEKPYKCQHAGCGKAFSQLSNLQSHSRSHMTDRPYRCNSCYKCFADEAGLREHIPKHSDTKHLKTHICRVCGKSYTQETYLARHMTKHSAENRSGSGGLGVVGGVVGGGGGLGKAMPCLMHPMARQNSEPLAETKCDLDIGCMERPSSAFMPLSAGGSSSGSGGGYPSPGLLKGPPAMPSNFAFPHPSPHMSASPHMTTSPLSHLSSPSYVSSPNHASSRYFSFDPFPRIDRRMGMSRDGAADSLLSLQQIKNFATSHPVFPKNEPSSPGT